MVPCLHIMAVIKDNQYLSPSMWVDETGIDINNGIDTLGHAVSASGHLSQQNLSMENMIKSSTPQQPQFNCTIIPCRSWNL